MSLSFDDFRALCEQRRSVRYFDKHPLTMEEVKCVLELALLAPSVANVQPWRFHVVFRKSLQDELMETACYGNFLPGASAFVIVTCDCTSKPKTGDVLWNPEEMHYSCVAAMEHILLGATAKGYASCWVSLHHGTAHTILNLKKTELVVGGIMLGRYKPGEEHPSGKHERHALQDVCTFYE